MPFQWDLLTVNVLVKKRDNFYSLNPQCFSNSIYSLHRCILVSSLILLRVLPYVMAETILTTEGSNGLTLEE